ncbi:polyprenyl synthetase family protein [Neorhodopirellula pilleata]|uniref:Farnesyl diphosphate synthase n=1 Tax=Neorhodopirellula pilleata TaxID=2714738 RepID=A0A5C6AAJ0_9BACT|nr:farnesyl diphosphate synthase [Neorhodopirellula pilleata]TWT96377.1 Farnesyl diphosphate synthase [Neorhodopirellula pilleata]
MSLVIDSQLAPFRASIEESLAKACQFADGCPPRLADAIRYSVLAPGKRLRPALVMMAAEACGGSIDDARPAAVAVEMIHAYSLIHDDLPAMDDDDLRRGRPTTHIQFGEATAILAGDALQAEAFGHLVRNVSDPATAARLIGELATAAGACGLVGGQEDDLAAEKIGIEDFESPRSARLHLESIHRRKTGALFVACVRMGAISANAGAEVIKDLGRFAELFGLAFQITDDVLDFTATDEQLGKRTQKDAGRGKLTFPHLMAAEQSALSQTSANPATSEVDFRAGIEFARAHAASLIRNAHDSLKLLGASAERLHIMADYILERTS